MKFLSPEVAQYLYKFTTAHAWNTVAMSGRVPLVEKRICYKNRYAGLLVLHLLPLLNPWLIVEM